MSKLKELIDRLCPDGVEYKPLGEVGTFIRGNGLQKKDFVDKGVGCIHYGQIYTYYGTYTSETKSFVSENLAKKLRTAQSGDLIIATTSENVEDVCKAVAWIGNNDIAVSSDAFIFHHSLNPKYVSYFFQTDSFQMQKKPYISGTKVMRISSENLAKIIIPIPPIEVQEEIVKILDRFADYAAELQAELQARKEQYEYYRNLLLTFNPSGCASGADDEQEMRLTAWGGHSYAVAWKTMGEIGKIKMCKRIMKHQTSKSAEIPFYKIGTFGKVADAYISKDLFNEYRTKYPYPTKGAILISAAGTIGRCVIFNGEESYFQDSNIVWLDNDETIVLNSYLYHYYQIVEWDTDGGTIKRLYNDRFLSTKIPIPPIELQEKIVAILDRFETLVNDLTQGLPAEIAAVKEQYEYYRNKLLTFKQIV